MYGVDEPQLQLTLAYEEHSIPVLSTFGEIDLHSVKDFDALLTRGVFEARKTGCLMVDLRGVELLDVIGFKTLLKARDRLHWAEAELVVVCDEQIKRWLENNGFSEAFDALYSDIRTAAESCLSPA